MGVGGIVVIRVGVDEVWGYVGDVVEVCCGESGIR